MNTQATIERFYRANKSDSAVSKQFLRVNGNSHDYYYQPNSRAFKPIEPRIASSGRVGQLGAKALRTLANYPRTAQILPRVQKTDLSIPEQAIPDAAIAGRRTKTFHLDDGLVYTFSDDSSVDLLSEVHIRQELPTEINVPAVVEVDEEYPYFAEEYIAGETLTHPVRQQEQFFMALEELRPLYEQRFVKWANISKFLETLKERLITKPYVVQPTIRSAYDLLESITLPKKQRISQVHGDFHVENIIIFDKDIYIIDWETSAVRPTTYDFFKQFEVHYTMSGKADLFQEMVTGTGPGYILAQRYADQFKSTVFDKEGFHRGEPILYLLYRLTEVNPETITSHPAYCLLNEIVLNQNDIKACSPV